MIHARTIMICSDFITRLIRTKEVNYMKKFYITLVALAMAVALIVPYVIVPAFACETPPGCECRTTGGATIGTDRDPRVTHGFELHCNVDQLPNNLEVNWGGNHFHLDTLTAVECIDDPAIVPNPPKAGCDTIHGLGTGSVNGVDGYQVEFIFTDAGEPGSTDWAWVKITDAGGTNTVMEVSGYLTKGNQQFHNCTGKDAK